jgi:hypothetical protein
MKTWSKAAAVAAMAGMMLAPAGVLARGGGGAGGGFARGGFHVGPVFGFPHAVAPHRAFGHGFARRWPARFAWRFHRWNFHRFAGRHGAGAGSAAVYPYAGDAAYVPSDVTGAIAAPEPAAMFAPSAPPPADHIGCQSRGYDVPGESGGLVKVMVTRC